MLGQESVKGSLVRSEIVLRPTIWGWGSVLDHLGGAVSGDGRPELVRQTGARPHIYNFAPVPSLAPLVPELIDGSMPARCFGHALSSIHDY